MATVREPQIIDAVPERVTREEARGEKNNANNTQQQGATAANNADAAPAKPRGKFKRGLILLFAVIYVLSPLDLLPEALMGPIGLLDDLGVLAWAARQVLFKRN